MRESPTELQPECAAQTEFTQLAAGSEAALDLFDASIALVEPETALLSGAPGVSLTQAMAKVVTALRQVDPERALRRQGWFHRFSGADLEARLQFEVSIRTISDAMDELTATARSAREAVALLECEVSKVEAATSSNTSLILAVRALLARGSFEDTARLERRLGNLEALHASHHIACAQMKLSINHLQDLLDRCKDIEQLLFPVWQQHALAIAHSAARPNRDVGERMSAFRRADSSLISALRRNKEAVS